MYNFLKISRSPKNRSKTAAQLAEYQQRKEKKDKTEPIKQIIKLK